jgi:hypothetical protein
MEVVIEVVEWDHCLGFMTPLIHARSPPSTRHLSHFDVMYSSLMETLRIVHFDQGSASQCCNISLSSIEFNIFGSKPT